MPERVLVFGKLEDIIFLKEWQAKLIWDKIDKINNPFPVSTPEECRFYSDGDNAGCCGCDFENDCDKNRKKYSAEIKMLENEKEGLNHELILLWHELHFHEQALYDKRIIK
ncbi:MAG: hypothetical protein Q7S81_00795 [bacterium]|nr:hypothetical protein [bacterium]